MHGLVERKGSNIKIGSDVGGIIYMKPWHWMTKDRINWQGIQIENVECTWMSTK